MKRSAVGFLAVMVCGVLAVAALVGCSGSGSSSSASSAAASSSASASESSSSANPTAKFVGTWKIAAAEMQGVTMGGNFGEYLGMDENGSLVINEDGTGKVALGEDSAEITWAQESSDSIYVTVQNGELSTQQAILVTAKDDALFMPFEQDGQQATIIFTKDGNYAGAKQISMTDAKPITSESALLGTWKLSGMNMGGVSITGDASAMQNVMGGEESWITFKEGGVAELNSGEGTWAVDANGATITTTDITGTNTCPVMMLGSEIAIDYSAVFGGTEFIIVMAKA